MWHLKIKAFFNLEQVPFRQDRSTEDQITYLTQEIEDAFQEEKHTLTVWVGMEKNFNKVWKEGLKLKLCHCRVAGHMHMWTDLYLKNRRAIAQISSTDCIQICKELYYRFCCYLVQRGIYIYC